MVPKGQIESEDEQEVGTEHNDEGTFGEEEVSARLGGSSSSGSETEVRLTYCENTGRHKRKKEYKKADSKKT